ncbi:NAD-dependent succinate-semialdehyde dehydrogenase [Limosilactobacillus mucosae]|uniref:NAD-dependent succinate-semialdehyde dehydrogenase n=1 Tax=Limosilactobacillus mucosae TaxID=97478 RepID=UPI0039944239
MAYQSIYPYTGELKKTYENQSDEYVEDKLQKADALYHEWRNQPLDGRAEILHAVADNLMKHQDELAKAMVQDMGKLFGEAKAEVALSAMIANWYADNAKDLLRPQRVYTIMGDAHYEYHSTGVIMAVEPWNFPYYQVMRVFAPNFMLGNPVMFKQASSVPTTASLLEKYTLEAGAPEGSLVNLFVTYDQIEKIIADPRVSGVALTGSERAGQKIAAEAGKYLKKSTMELGGSDPFIVLDDADLDDIKKILYMARLFNAGQECTSAKRFIVTEKNYDRFLEMLKEEFGKAKMGDPMNPKTTLAPLSSKSAADDLHQQVKDAIAHGATLAYGDLDAPTPTPNGFWMPAVILTDVTRDNPAYYQEFFGPVGVVYKVADEEEAIKLANDSHYGLGGQVFAGHSKHAAEVASKIETGAVYCNNFRGSIPELQFGGVKNSGYGRELGRAGILAFANEQMIMRNPYDKIDLNHTIGGFV